MDYIEEETFYPPGYDETDELIDIINEGDPPNFQEDPPIFQEKHPIFQDDPPPFIAQNINIDNGEDIFDDNMSINLPTIDNNLPTIDNNQSAIDNNHSIIDDDKSSTEKIQFMNDNNQSIIDNNLSIIDDGISAIEHNQSINEENSSIFSSSSNRDRIVTNSISNIVNSFIDENQSSNQSKLKAKDVDMNDSLLFPTLNSNFVLKKMEVVNIIPEIEKVSKLSHQPFRRQFYYASSIYFVVSVTIPNNQPNSQSNNSNHNYDQGIILIISSTTVSVSILDYLTNVKIREFQSENALTKLEIHGGAISDHKDTIITSLTSLVHNILNINEWTITICYGGNDGSITIRHISSIDLSTDSKPPLIIQTQSSVDITCLTLFIPSKVWYLDYFADSTDDSSPDNELWICSGSVDGYIQLMNALTGQLIRNMNTQSVCQFSSITSIASYSPGGINEPVVITGSSDNNICIWNTNSGNLINSSIKKKKKSYHINPIKDKNIVSSSITSLLLYNPKISMGMKNAGGDSDSDTIIISAGILI